MQLLVFASGPRRGRRVGLEGDTLKIGRDRGNEIVTEDENASRTHAELERRNDKYVLRDLGSTNGTFVNGVRVTETELRSGDKIIIGDTLLVYEERRERQPGATVTFREPLLGEEKMQIRLAAGKTRLFDPAALAAEPTAAEKLALLYKLTSEMSQNLSKDRLIAEILNKTLQVVPADRAFIMLVDQTGSLKPADLRLRTPDLAAREIVVSRHVTETVLSSGDSIFSSNALRDKRFKDSTAIADLHVGSFICAPLKHMDHILGLFYVDTIDDAPPLGEPDFQFITALSAQAGVQLANARLYEELMDSVQYTRSVLRCLRSGILVTDLDGVVREANDAARRLVGLPEEGLVGRPMASFENLKPMARLIEDTARSGIPCERQELSIAVEGKELPIGLSTAILRDHEGKSIGVVTNFRNLSVINKLAKQLRAAQTLAALGEMSAAIAHEIRNPLNSIRGFSQLIQESCRVDMDEELVKTHKNYLHIIIEEVDRMNRLVQNLLDFSRQHDLTMMTTDLGRLVLDTLAKMEPELKEKNVKLVIEVPPGLPRVLGNPPKLEQVLINVIRNAVQAMSGLDFPEGKERYIEVRAGPVSQETGSAMEVTIADTGVGIDGKTLPRIFDPFFTTKERGTGLGLAICRKIIEQHDGRIQAETRPGGGAVFRITLPRSPR